MGPSGAGKSTHVRENFPDAWVCAPDAFRIEDGKYVFRHSSEPDRLCRQRFRPYVEEAQAMGYSLRFLVVGFDVTVDELVERNQHGTPREAIEAQLRNVAKLLTDWPENWPAPEYV